MEVANPFINIGDNFMAEAWNGAILFFAATNMLLNLTLPADLDGGNFLQGTVDQNQNMQYVKAGFLLTNLTLVNTQITNNTIQLLAGQTTGTATFRVYPNIEPFKLWKSISWVKSGTGTINCTIKRVSNGSVIDSNIANPKDLSAESMALEYIDFVFTLTQVSGNNPILNTVNLILQGGF